MRPVSCSNDLSAHLDEMDPESDEAALVRLVQREYEKRARVPSN